MSNRYLRLTGAATVFAAGLTILASPIGSAQGAEPERLNYTQSDFMAVEFTPIPDDVKVAFHLDEEGNPTSPGRSTNSDSPRSSRTGSKEYIPEISITPRTVTPRPTASTTTGGTRVLPPVVESVEDVGSLSYAGPSGSSLEDLDISYSDSVGEKVVKLAMTQLGVPYVWGGTTPNVGVDCSGLIQWAYSEAGVSIPRVSWDQINSGTKVSVNEIKPGDVVGYNSGGHVALYIGNNQVVHAPYTGTVVQVADLRMMPIESVTRWAT